MTTYISHSGLGRHACPFYGFYIYMADGFSMEEEIPFLMDQQGNQCPLIRDSHSPCQMERRDQTPNWNDCPLNNDENRKFVEQIDSYSVAPRELWPEGKSSWKGIPFSEWKKRVMGE